MKVLNLHLILLLLLINISGCREDTGRTKKTVHGSLTNATIDQTKDEKLLQLVYEYLISKMAKDLSDEYSVVMNFNKSQQAIYVIWGLQSEVENGGFNQYYYNSPGQFAKLAPDALKLVGANQFTQLVTRANKIFETENKNIKKQQDGTLEGFSKSYESNPLNKLDKEFYALESKENLEVLQIDYIRKQKADFVDR
jgi:hypothetical protein